MATLANLQSLSLSHRKRHGRAVNAVSEYLRKTLAVPHIFIEPRNIAGTAIDVMAVDRAGSGDVHAVEVKLLSDAADARRGIGADLRSIRQGVQQVKKYPFHFKYLALPAANERLANDPVLFASDGIGRIGILLIEESEVDLPKVSLLVKPERFKVEPSKMLTIEKFLLKAKPDMEVRI